MARRTKEEACVTRANLLDAAEQVFYEKGVARASLNEIACRAGATRGAVYWHFRDKLDLFYAMLERVTPPLERAVYEVEVDGLLLIGLDRARYSIASVFRQLESDARTRRVFEILLHKVEYVGELIGVQERNLASMVAFDHQLEECLRIAWLQQRVGLVVDLGEAALALRALFDGLIKSWLLAGGVFELERVGMFAVDAYLAGLGLDVRPTRV